MGKWIRQLSHCCSRPPEIHNLKGRRANFGSWFQKVWLTAFDSIVLGSMRSEVWHYSWEGINKGVLPNDRKMKTDQRTDSTKVEFHWRYLWEHKWLKDSCITSAHSCTYKSWNLEYMAQPAGNSVRQRLSLLGGSVDGDFPFSEAQLILAFFRQLSWSLLPPTG